MTVVFIAGAVLWYRQDAAASVASSRRSLAEDAQSLHSLLAVPSDGAYQTDSLDEIGRTSAGIRASVDSIRRVTRGSWLTARILDYRPIDSGLEDSSLQQAYLLSREASRRAAFWGALPPATAEILAYDAEVDLLNIEPERDGPELVRRMYFAKGGLMRSVEHMAVVVANANDDGAAASVEQQMREVQEHVDAVIDLTVRGRYAEARAAQDQFATEIRELQRSTNAYLNSPALQAYSLVALRENAAELVNVVSVP